MRAGVAVGTPQQPVALRGGGWQSVAVLPLGHMPHRWRGQNNYPVAGSGASNCLPVLVEVSDFQEDLLTVLTELETVAAGSVVDDLGATGKEEEDRGFFAFVIEIRQRGLLNAQQAVESGSRQPRESGTKARGRGPKWKGRTA